MYNLPVEFKKVNIILEDLQVESLYLGNKMRFQYLLNYYLIKLNPSLNPSLPESRTNSKVIVERILYNLEQFYTAYRYHY